MYPSRTFLRALAVGATVLLSTLGLLAQGNRQFIEPAARQQQAIPSTNPTPPATQKRTTAEATALNQKGLQFLQDDELDNALKCFEQSLAIRRELYPQAQFPKGHPDLAQSFNNLGSALQAMGDFAPAEKCFLDALKMRESFYPKERFPEGHSALATSLNNLGGIYSAQQDHNQSEFYYRAALKMRQDLYPASGFPNGHPDLYGSYNNVGSALLGKGEFAEAAGLYRQALAIQQKLYPKSRFPKGHPELVEALDSLGINLIELGEFTAAETVFDDALKMAVELYPRSQYALGHPQLAKCRGNVAKVLVLRGEFAQAELILREVLKMERELYTKVRFPQGHPRLSTRLNNLGYVLMKQGFGEQAEVHFRAALKINESLYPTSRYPMGHIRVATSLNNLSQALQAQQQFPQAETVLRDALTIWQNHYPKPRYPKGHLDIAVGLNNLGFLLAAKESYDQAESSHRAAYEMRKELFPRSQFPKGHLHLAESLSNLGMIFKEQGLFEKALAHYQASTEMHRELLGREHPGVLGPLGHLAFIHNLQGDVDESRKLAQEARKILLAARLRAQFTGLDRSVFSSGKMPLMQLIAVLLAGDGKAEEAWEANEQELARGLFDDLTARTARPLTLQQRQKEETLQTRLAFLDRRIPELLGGKPHLEEADKLRKERESVLLDLGQHYAALEKQLGPVAGQVFDLKRIQGQLDADTAIVGWRDIAGHAKAKNRDGDHWSVVVRSQGPPIWVRLTGSGPEGSWSARDEKRPSDIRAILARGNADVDWEAPLAEFNRLSLAPLRKHLEGIRHLVVLPSERMAGIPIEALTDKYHISYAPSATVYAWLRENRKELAGNSLLAVGASAFSAEQAKAAGPKGIDVALRDERFGPLLGTQHEVQAIAKAFTTKGNKVQALLGPDAVLSKLEGLASEKKLDQFRYIHLATHGKALPQNGLSSFLTLTSEDYALMDYGKLSAGQIMKTWKLNADLVTLSACQTALGQKQGGEGYLGFSQALLLSGSRSLVLSQWSVSDHAASLLMIRFYQNLLGQRDGLKQPLSKLEALEEARRWLRELPREEAIKMLAGTPADFLDRMPRGERPFAHPSFWAAFIFVGDPGS